MSEIIFSCCIPAKDENDPKLKDLIDSIRAQNFPQDQIEIIVITEGDSEWAKGEAIRRSKGQICAMFCADNYITDKSLFQRVWDGFNHDECPDAVYEQRYAYMKNDNSLNRYFSLIGCNDPVPFYLGKCDREPWAKGLYKPSRFSLPSYGCNGFFVKRKCFDRTDLNKYYPMDAHSDMSHHKNGMAYLPLDYASIWHRTSDNLISFLIKRYKYARDLYCDRMDRRWRMLDTKHDYFRLGLFVLATATIIPCLATSVRGFLKVRDSAWFWHWPVCVGFLITYGLLACRNLLKHRYLFHPMDAVKV